nr:hypothetical protein [Tanacetum cinerariifolium]
ITFEAVSFDAVTSILISSLVRFDAFTRNYDVVSRHYVEFFKRDQDRHMLMVDDNVENQFRENAVHNVGHLVGHNAIESRMVLSFSNSYRLLKRKKQGSKALKRNLSSWPPQILMKKLNQLSYISLKIVMKNDIFNMFTQEEQYTELLEPIPEPHQVQQKDSNVILAVSSVEQSGRTVEQHHANVEETRVLYDLLYNNLAFEVEKVNSVNRKLRETNADKLERCY